MHLKKLLSSSAFRLALSYGALFGFSSIVLLLFIYLSTASYMQRQADETIEAEIVGLDESYRANGLSGLTTSIQTRIGGQKWGGPSIYLLTDGFYTPIAGNLDRWPRVNPDEKGWINFELNITGKEPKHTVRSKSFFISSGFHLLVGRDMHELDLMRKRLAYILSWGLAMTVFLALLGGFVMTRSRLRRIGAINEAIDGIIKGDLTRRIPTESKGSDIEELVEKLNRTLSEFEKLVEGVRRVSDNIAHDLKTPLSRLKTRLEYLRQSTNSEDADKAAEEADEILATFAALLRIARIESGERRSAFGDINLTALIDDVADLYQPLLEERDKKLFLHNSPGITLCGDRDMLFQAVANLVDNALKHSPPNGQIEIALRSLNQYIEIIIADDGPGIPESEREQVLIRFYRLDKSRTTVGSGLGLSLVSAVVELHNGKLILEDGSNNRGLRVVIRLPYNEL